MVLTNNGYVGLGVGNTNPSFILDVKGRMRLRSGGNDFISAGLWLNNNANTEAAFIGMEDDTHIGFFGNSPAGWKFGMNTVTGALRVNGSDGAAGQVITSNGSSNAAQWKSPTNSLYNNVVLKVQNADLTMYPVLAPSPIPNLSHTFTAAGNAKVLVSISLNVVQPNCICSGTTASIDLQLDGSHVATFSTDLEVANNHILKAEFIVPVGAGTHTIRVIANSPPPGENSVVQYIGSSPFPGNVVFTILPE